MDTRRIPLKDIPVTGKFIDPDVTVDGSTRAWVSPVKLETLWINTGSRCNLTCEHCYVESSPTNDLLSYVSLKDVRILLDEIETEHFDTTEIGFTGGEPFLNPAMIPILELTLSRGFSVLILTNAMNTMLRKKPALEKLNEQHPGKLKLRVSLDHYQESRHAEERGPRSWKPAIEGLRWLSETGFPFSVAGRTFWNEDEQAMRGGFAAMFQREGIALDANNDTDLILFPEMDVEADIAEITTECWSILGKNPDDVMCATSRMVVKHKGDQHLSVMACTLLPYDQRFNLGNSLKDAWRDVKLNHPHCAQFCVLGGASCSG